MYKSPLHSLFSSPSSLFLLQQRQLIRMNHFEMRGSSIPVFCPKPRRVGQLSGPDPLRPIHWHTSDQSDGADLFDIFLTKGGDFAMSPPYFAGSPPARSANPLVHDARFVEDKPDPLPVPIPGSPRSGFARTKFGFKPAPIQIEGFDCRLDRDRGHRGSHSISAMA